MKLSVEDIIRFREKLLKIGECLEFIGGLSEDGYGCFYANGTRYLSHRVAFMISCGKNPGLDLVCHTCDNPPCCNPEHLFLGSGRVNVLDSVSKGRHSSKILFGEARPNAELTEEKVRQIRYKSMMGYTLHMLAKEYKVDHSTIHQVVTRKTWRHM